LRRVFSGSGRRSRPSSSTPRRGRGHHHRKMGKCGSLHAHAGSSHMLAYRDRVKDVVGACLSRCLRRHNVLQQEFTTARGRSTVLRLPPVYGSGTAMRRDSRKPGRGRGSSMDKVKLCLKGAILAFCLTSPTCVPAFSLISLRAGSASSACTTSSGWLRFCSREKAGPSFQRKITSGKIFARHYMSSRQRPPPGGKTESFVRT